MNYYIAIRDSKIDLQNMHTDHLFLRAKLAQLEFSTLVAEFNLASKAVEEAAMDKKAAKALLDEACTAADAAQDRVAHLLP